MAASPDAEGAAAYEVAVTDPGCEVWWHLQAYNALPLPLMTSFVLGGDAGW